MSKIEIFGRYSSHYTRVPLIFAEELSLPYELVPIHDMKALGPEIYAGNPALKLPILRSNGTLLFGSLNICRALAEMSASPKRIAWPEALHDNLSRNAQELVWHCMAMQVQIVFGTLISKLPADNPYFVKAFTSFGNSLLWLDSNLEAALHLLPPRDLSLLEVSLYCLIEHLVFRPTVALDPYPSLVAFGQRFAVRPSAQRTVYRFDKRPA